eukprot:Gb_05211 [translate_table: standard]
MNYELDAGWCHGWRYYLNQMAFLDGILQLQISRCKTGKHTSEKPQTKAAPSPNKPMTLSVTGNTAFDTAKAACSRCRQGFFCSDHGSQVIVNARPIKTVPSENVVKPKPAAPVLETIIDLNQKQLCRNKSCGKNFTERDNHETACHYHPGPAVFHDRLRGVSRSPIQSRYLQTCDSLPSRLVGIIPSMPTWQCCDVHVKEFDEFLTIPPCTEGWHNANPDS